MIDRKVTHCNSAGCHAFQGRRTGCQFLTGRSGFGVAVGKGHEGGGVNDTLLTCSGVPTSRHQRYPPSTSARGSRGSRPIRLQDLGVFYIQDGGAEAGHVTRPARGHVVFQIR